MNDPSPRTDRELFTAVTAGELQALAELAGRHARGLYDFALRGTLDEQQASAVVEAVFRRMREPGAEVPNQIDFRTWLYSLCLVEVLAVANEQRTARISTDDERFFVRTTSVDPDVAHRVWQAARGLRTRDYCVLDLTLRRGLTPEEVAEAASLTRSNLYASIGRARGAFEETFAAMLLFEYGRDACPDLEEMLEDAPGDSLRPALRHQVIEHADDCDACRRTLDALPPAANVFISLANVDMPETLVRRLLGQAPAAEPEPEPEPVDEPALAPIGATAASAAFAAGVAALNRAPDDDSADEAEDTEVTAEELDEDAEFERLLAEEQAAADREAMAIVEDAGDQPDDGFDGDDEPDDEEFDESDDEDDEGDKTPAAAWAAPAIATFGRDGESQRGPAPVPVTPVHVGPGHYVDDEGFGERVAGWFRGQPLLWTYALLGVMAVLAIYIGVAVADSLQSGGDASGALPLDVPAGATEGRLIDCGDSPIEMDAGGPPSLVSFDQDELDGYSIQTLSFAPASEFAQFEDLEATLENPFSIRFVAKPQETAEERTEEFELRIVWHRGEEAANSVCRLLVNISPP